MIADVNQTPVEPEKQEALQGATEAPQEGSGVPDITGTVLDRKMRLEKYFRAFTDRNSDLRRKITKNEVVNVIAAWSKWGFEEGQPSFANPLEDELFNLMLEMEQFRQLLWSAALQDLKQKQADELKMRELQGESNGQEVSTSEVGSNPSPESQQ